MFEFLGQFLTVIAVVGLLATVCFTAATLILIGLHHELREQGQAREAEILALDLPRDEDLPHVVVQLPCFNEGSLAARALRYAADLDWPHDKLHLQLLDDSTEPLHPATTEAIADVRAAGVDLLVLRRAHRADFKAGALRAGMAAMPRDYFAILDADYVPNRDFLRLVMRGFIHDPTLAFVQARFDFINPDDNALTKAQRLLLDAHLAVEQATRSWAGHPLPFNGTCGVWQRSVVDIAGGWRGETLAEDLDLSYRALRAGHRGLFLTSVAVAGELPADIKSWSSQQRRWTKGFGQVARTMLPTLMQDRHLSPADRFGALLHLGAWWGPPVGVASFLVSLAAMALHAQSIGWLLPLLVAVNLIGIGTTLLFLRTGNLFLRGDSLSFWQFLKTVGTIATLGLRVALVNVAAYWETIRGRGTSFVRTPKSGNSR